LPVQWLTNDQVGRLTLPTIGFVDEQLVDIQSFLVSLVRPERDQQSITYHLAFELTDYGVAADGFLSKLYKRPPDLSDLRTELITCWD